MLVVTVTRKPLEGTVVQNHLKWGTGGVNIKASRIGTQEFAPVTYTAKAGIKDGKVYGEFKGGTYGGHIGRWPANLILSHMPGCRQVGTRKVKATSVDGPGPVRRTGVHSEVGGHQTIGRQQPPVRGYGSDDGMETLTAWECDPDCPVTGLDIKSGVSTSSKGVTVYRRADTTSWKERGGSFTPGREWEAEGYGDTGGASRFYKQVSGHGNGGEAMSTVPQDLIDYLVTMISPPGQTAIFWGGIPEDLSGTPDKSICGLILRAPKGQPTEAQSAELLRILMPGAHLLLIAPDDEPTGHTGTCRIEDAGFEIRDSICWANQAGDADKMHYIPKAARSEREAGCQNLPGKTAEEAVNRDPESAGAQNPRAGAGRGAGAPIYHCKLCDLNLQGGRAVSECPESPSGEHVPEQRGVGSSVKNHHPTVKPIDLMERLLWDVPKDNGPVLDPFMGSGTTGIACLKTGHDFIGIERESEYLAIDDARIRHWRDKLLKGDRWDEVVIESDYVPPADPASTKPKSTFEDMW